MVTLHCLASCSQLIASLTLQLNESPFLSLGQNLTQRLPLLDIIRRRFVSCIQKPLSLERVKLPHRKYHKYAHCAMYYEMLDTLWNVYESAFAFSKIHRGDTKKHLTSVFCSTCSWQVSRPISAHFRDPYSRWKINYPIFFHPRMVAVALRYDVEKWPRPV